MSAVVIAGVVLALALIRGAYLWGWDAGYDKGVNDAKRLDVQLNHLEAKLTRLDTIAARSPRGTTPPSTKGSDR